MSVEEFKEKLEGCHTLGSHVLEKKAYLVLLWHTGVRKSEAYERVKDDMQTTETHVIVNFHQRKKSGLEVPPLKIPRHFYGVNEYLMPYLSKPKRNRLKTIERYKRENRKQILVSTKQNAKWIFPHIGRETARSIVKHVLGEKYYPHYLRLNKLSKVGKNRKRGTIMHLRAISGIKSLRALEAYLGIEEEMQDEAMEISE